MVHEFMELEYQDAARLYVPLARLDLVQKYRALDAGGHPTLDKLGGCVMVAHQSARAKSMQDMAEELLKLYAERKMAPGVAYASDNPWQREFEEAFEFDETPDQLATIEDVRRDMEKPEPMDRLICGDVGYGKTEVAMRAAFRAVTHNKQVAGSRRPPCSPSSTTRHSSSGSRLSPSRSGCSAAFAPRAAKRKQSKTLNPGSSIL